MPKLNGDEQKISRVLSETKVIAVVGHSHHPQRPSYQVAQFLKSVGYRVYPVNPQHSEINGVPCYKSLKDIPESIDLVNVFRRSEYLNEIVEQTIAIKAKTIWTQLGIYDSVAEEKAINAGLNVVTNVCIKIEYLRLKSLITSTELSDE